MKDKISACRPSYQNSHSQRDEGDGDVLQQQRPPPEGAVCLLLPLPRGRRRGRDGTVHRVQLHQFCRIFDTLAWEILCESEPFQEHLLVNILSLHCFVLSVCSNSNY